MANDKECPKATYNWENSNNHERGVRHRLSTLLTFKPVHRELNAAYDFRLRLYVDITSGLDTRAAP
jgi:hypothetical protein